MTFAHTTFTDGADPKWTAAEANKMGTGIEGVETKFDTHNHNAQYLGISAQAVDSAKLGGQLPAYFAIATHNHDATYLGINANAVSASKWATARTLTVNGAETGSVSIDGSANATLTLTVAHNHDAAYLGIAATATNSDKLDGQHGSYYQTADNINAGTLPNARMSTAPGAYTIDPKIPDSTSQHYTALDTTTIGALSLLNMYNAYVFDGVAQKIPSAIEYTYDGTTWNALTASTYKQVFAGINAGGALQLKSSGNDVSGAWHDLRITWHAGDWNVYYFMKYLYMYTSTSGHSMQVQIQESKDGTTYTTLGTYTGINTWPGHTFISHPYIPWCWNNVNQYDYIRLIFTPTWNGTYPNNNITISLLKWLCPYPEGSTSSLPFVWNFDRQLTFYNNLTTPGQFISTVATGTAPLSVTSTTVVPNLNVSQLEGHASAYFATSTHNHDATYLGINANAVSASKWATARTITVNGAETGSVSIDGSAAATLTLTVNHNHDAAYLGISAQAADSNLLDGHDSTYFATATHNHDSVYLALGGGIMTSDLKFACLTGSPKLYVPGYHSSTENVCWFEKGTADSAGWNDAVNTVLNIWNGLSIKNPTGGGTFPNQSTILIDSRSGTLNAKGNLYVNGAAVWHSGNFTPSSKLDASANAVSASKWATARTLTFTGADTGSGSIDGSGDVSIALTVNHNHDSTYLKLAGGTLTGGVSTNSQITSTVASGTAPFVITSPTLVAHLNADLLDGNEASAFATAGHNHDAAYLGINATATNSTQWSGKAWPTNAAGYLKNDGSGGVSWSPITLLPANAHGLLHNDGSGTLSWLAESTFAAASHQHAGTDITSIVASATTATQWGGHAYPANPASIAFMKVGSDGSVSLDTNTYLTTAGTAANSTKWNNIAMPANADGILHNNGSGTLSWLAESTFLAAGAQAVDSAKWNGKTMPANASGALTNDGTGNLTWVAGGTATNSDKLDGYDASYFATATHNHDAVYLGISAQAADSAKWGGKSLPANAAGALTNDGSGNLSWGIAGSSMPVGATTYFATDVPPSGWLLADGSAVSRTTYSDLFAAIGTKFGSGDGTTTFNLPSIYNAAFVDIVGCVKYTADDTTASVLSPGVLGALSATGNISAGGQLVSGVLTGTAPITVLSTTLCPNLNADLLDDHEAAYFATADHNHDSVYAAIGHNHDSVYAAIGHNHDATYLKIDGTTATTGTLSVATGNAFKIGAAYFSVNGDVANLSTHEYYGPTGWVGDGTVGGTLQVSTYGLYFYSHDATTPTPGRTELMHVSNTGNLVTTGSITAGGDSFFGSGDADHKVKLTSAWSSYPDASTYGSEIANDTNAYKTLMIIGNKSAGGNRHVDIWDQLNVNGTLLVNGVSPIRAIGAIVSKGSCGTNSGTSVYYASTDGFVMVQSNNWGNGGCSTNVYSDTNSNPSTCVLTTNSNAYGGDWQAMTVPIKAGNYYKVGTWSGGASQSGTTYMYWIPLA